MLIGGEWRQAASSEEIEVVNPATEEVVGSVPSGDVADVELAVATAKRAFAEWARTDTEKRAHVVGKAADLIEERASDIAALLTSEQGKPVAEARGEVAHLAHGLRYYAEAATKVRGAYQELPSAFGPAYGQVLRRPMGVCAAMIFWPDEPAWAGLSLRTVGPAWAARTRALRDAVDPWVVES